MVKEKSESSKILNLISARVHCETCRIRFVQEVEIEGIPKKGIKTKTKCKTCTKNKINSFLIFDRIYKK